VVLGTQLNSGNMLDFQFNAQLFQLLLTANLVMLYSNNIEIPSDVEIQMLESVLIPSKTII